MSEVLDNAAWASLTGPHAHFAEGTGRALRYPADVSPITAVAPNPDEQVWADLFALVGPNALVLLGNEVNSLPDGWRVEFEGDGLQFVATDALESRPSSEVVTLGAADVPEHGPGAARLPGPRTLGRAGPAAGRAGRALEPLGADPPAHLISAYADRSHPLP